MTERPKLLIADKNHDIFEVPYLEATGMKGKEHFRLKHTDMVKLHPDSELFLLPDRSPIGYDPDFDRYVELPNNVLAGSDEPCFAVAAFVSPGYTVTYNASYRERGKPKMLPLFSYAAVAHYKGEFYTTAVRVDREKRQELSDMPPEEVKKNINTIRKMFSGNRLFEHLVKCALEYGCPAAKNLFLKRYECPLPSSPTCNSSCIGCISYQPGNKCSITQPRIKFVPTPEEIADIAAFHIKNAKDPVVSFGQGCEGEPLLQGEVIETAIKLIRKNTSKGVINLNTNASKPDVISRLAGSGLNSIRVSMNSMVPDKYTLYYKPKGYKYDDVIGSIKLAKRKGMFVSINYLVMPGFNDSLYEISALRKILDNVHIDMIQWRNLNYDPAVYSRKMKLRIGKDDMISMDKLINLVHKEYPHIMKGYFNPSKTRIERAGKKV